MSRAARYADPLGAFTVLAATFAVAFGADRSSPWLGNVRRSRPGLSREIFPVGSADFVRTSRLRGPMFNSFMFGGYLIHRLWPQARVFIDGRTSNVYSEAFLRTLVDLDSNTWRPLFARHRIEYAVVAHDTVSAALARDRSWALVFFDDLASVFVRIAGVNADLAQARGYRLLLPARILNGGVGVGTPPAVLTALLSEADRAVADAPTAAMPREVRAMVRAAMHDVHGFERDLRAAIAANPSRGDACYVLGRFELASGRLADARRELICAIAREPSLRAARELLALACLFASDATAAREAAAPLAGARGDIDEVLRALADSPIGRHLRARRAAEP